MHFSRIGEMEDHAFQCGGPAPNRKGLGMFDGDLFCITTSSNALKGGLGLLVATDDEHWLAPATVACCQSASRLSGIELKWLQAPSFRSALRKRSAFSAVWRSVAFQ